MKIKIPEDDLLALIDENKKLRTALEAARAVCWFDWSGNDDDAVAAIERLRQEINK